jgi:hypothetical protein
MLGASNFAITLNSVVITAYCNKTDYDRTTGELDKTNFASSGNESDPGMTAHKINIGGLWSKALNNVLSPLANSPQKVTLIYVVGSGAEAVTHTWTGGAFLTNYKITAGATSQTEWSGTLNLSNAPTMS